MSVFELDAVVPSTISIYSVSEKKLSTRAFRLGYNGLLCVGFLLTSLHALDDNYRQQDDDQAVFNLIPIST